MAADVEQSAVRAAPAQRSPVLATTPAARAAIATLEAVCLPLLRGADLKRTTAAGGFHQKDGAWVLKIDGERRVELQPPTNVNPHICSATIYSAVGGDSALRSAVDSWAGRQSPPLTPQKVNQTEAGPNYLRSTSSWSGQSAAGQIGVVLSEQHTAAGLPAAGNLDRSNMLVSLTPM